MHLAPFVGLRVGLLVGLLVRLDKVNWFAFDSIQSSTEIHPLR